MDIKRFICLIVCILFTAVQTRAIEDELFFKPVEITDGSSISVLDCVAAAFKNSPKIKRQKYNLDIAKSNLGIAKSQYFPVISAGAGFYNENNSDNIYYNPHYRELPSVGVTVNKLIWNFGKTTAYIKMEEFYKIGAEYEFMDSLCATLFDVKAKYYNLLKAKAMLDIADNNLKLNEKFVKSAKGKADLAAAKTYLDKAKINYIEASNNYINAKVDLNNSMYLDEQPDYSILNTPTFDYSKETIKPFEAQKFNFAKEDAVQIAYDNSPDLRVLESSKSAMEQSLLYIKRTYFPDLTANAGYGFYNTNQTSNNSFNVGVSLNSTVNLMELKHSIKEADAQINLADNEITLFKKDLYFEVKRAFNNVEKSQRQIPTAQAQINKAGETLKIVESQYAGGELNYVALQNARQEYILAHQKYIDCLYDYNMALIQTEMATHYHIVDIHHKSDHAVHYHPEDLINHLNEALGCDEKENNKKHKERL